jgi:pimeloyl-ACP methyl ester carboxylesterase
MSRPLDLKEGVLSHGLPYLRFGSGPPLVVLRGFMTVHANPTGIQRIAETLLLAPLARHFRVYAVGRAPGLPPGTTMRDIADQHAHALNAEFGGPVDVLGISSGGSVALQLAADHPAAVRRLVLASAGHRLGPAARQAQLRYAEAVTAGRRGAHFLAPLKATSPMGARLLTPVMWLLDAPPTPRTWSPSREPRTSSTSASGSPTSPHPKSPIRRRCGVTPTGETASDKGSLSGVGLAGSQVVSAWCGVSSRRDALAQRCGVGAKLLIRFLQARPERFLA